jgi:hypothetical protein
MNDTLNKATPGPWRDAALAGLPHVLYALMLYIPLMTYDLRTHGLAVLLEPLGDYPRYNYYGAPRFWPQIFWMAVVVFIAVGLWRRAPRWSASWIGYGLHGLLGWVLNAAPSSLPISVTLALAWLALTLGTIFWLGRRDLLSGLLAVLPIAPMWMWYLQMDTVISNLEGFVYVPAGLLVGIVAAMAVRRGDFRVGLWSVLGVILLMGLPVNYSANFYPFSPFNGWANPGAVLGGSFGDVLAFAIVAVPLWIVLAWRRTHRLTGV